MQITPTLPSATPLPQAAGSARGLDNGFADLLQQARPPAPEHAAAEAADAPESGAGAQRPDESRAARTRAGERSRTARSANPAPPQRGTAPAERRADEAAEAERTGDPRPAESAAAALDPALAHWLAALHLPPGATAPAEGGARAPGGARTQDTGTDDAVPADDASAGTAVADRHDPRTTAHRAGGRDEDARGGARDALARAAADAAETAQGERAETALQSASATPLPANPHPGAAEAGPAGAAALAAPPRAADPSPSSSGAGAPADLAFATPVDAPEFARAFGVQVSVLARDGVQQAELHLNPVETGPVSVQIALDGTQARIDFGADAAATRQAIEQSLPDLAAALREAGFTLSGGGVAPHAGGRDNGQGRHDSAGDGQGRNGAQAEAGANDAPRAAARPWRGRMSASGVDLYA